LILNEYCGTAAPVGKASSSDLSNAARIFFAPGSLPHATRHGIVTKYLWILSATFTRFRIQLRLDTATDSQIASPEVATVAIMAFVLPSADHRSVGTISHRRIGFRPSMDARVRNSVYLALGMRRTAYLLGRPRPCSPAYRGTAVSANRCRFHLRNPWVRYHTQQHTVGERTRPADTKKVQRSTYHIGGTEKTSHLVMCFPRRCVIKRWRRSLTGWVSPSQEARF
jgi:hypothetical protein